MTPDIVVIGGGLAGGAVAAQLACAGRNVLLLEREPGLHDKVCGEFLSVEAQHYLAALGVDLDALGAATITRSRLASGRRSASGDLPFVARSVSRRALDAAVLARAAQAGAQVRCSASVTGLQPEGDGWRVSLADGETIAALTVMLATGKYDLRGWARAVQPGPQYIGFKQYFRGVDPAALTGDVVLQLFDGGYAGLERVEGDCVNLCLVVDKAAYAQQGRDWTSLYESLLQDSPALRAALGQAVPLWPKPLAIAQIPYGFVAHAPAPTGLYRLGDQAAVIPSFCGDGMAIALHSAARAAAVYLVHGPAGAARYQRALAAELTPQIARAVRISRALRQPLFAKPIIAAARLFPGLLTTAARRTRLQGWA